MGGFKVFKVLPVCVDKSNNVRLVSKLCFDLGHLSSLSLDSINQSMVIPTAIYPQVRVCTTLSNMALLPSKSNSSFTWCCSSSVRAVPPYRSWEEKNIVSVILFLLVWLLRTTTKDQLTKKVPSESCSFILSTNVSPLLATRCVCSFHHRHFRRDIVLKKTNPIYIIVMWLFQGYLCYVLAMHEFPGTLDSLYSPHLSSLCKT